MALNYEKNTNPPVHLRNANKQHLSLTKFYMPNLSSICQRKQ